MFDPNTNPDPDPTVQIDPLTGKPITDPSSTPTPTATATPAATTPTTQTTVGHDDLYQGWTRDQYRDAWQSSGATGLDALRSFLAQHGGTLQADNGTVMTPWGEQIDMMIGAKTGNGTPGWGAAPGMVGYGTAAGAGGAGSASGANGSVVGSSMSSLTTDPRDAQLRQQLIDQLMQRAGQSLNVNAATDPNIRQQADPYAAAQERAARNFMADLAEKSGPNANLTGQDRVAQEHAAQASGGFEASLIGHEIDSRRTEIQNALTGMQGLLTTDQQQMLQKELGYLNDATQRYGIQSQASTAANAQNIDWQRALLQNEQFNNNLNYESGDRSAYWDFMNKHPGASA